jgi:hypothetical protein
MEELREEVKLRILVHIESSVLGVLVLTISELKVKLFALFPEVMGIGRSEQTSIIFKKKCLVEA